MRNPTEKYSYSLRATTADNDKPYKQFTCRSMKMVEAKELTQGCILKTTEAEVVGLPGDFVVKTVDGFIFIRQCQPTRVSLLS